MAQRSKFHRVTRGRALNLAVLAGAAGLLLAGCAGARNTPGKREASIVSTSRASVRSTSPGASVKVMQTQYGRVLADGDGRALYLFTRDRTPSSRCHGACAERWPPFLTTGAPAAGPGAQGSLLGTTARAGGSVQVTYHGHPLYYYVGDRRPGQVLCQGVEEFGGSWYVLTRRGSAVR
jgi:predicted lipoprotein with Yx(FWY)xxD motif